MSSASVMGSMSGAEGRLGRKGGWGEGESGARVDLGRGWIWGGREPGRGGREYGAEGPEPGPRGGREPGAEGRLGRKGGWGGTFKLGIWGGREAAAKGSTGRKDSQPGVDPLTGGALSRL
jgi:hypothetical protein